MDRHLFVEYLLSQGLAGQLVPYLRTQYGGSQTERVMARWAGVEVALTPALTAEQIYCVLAKTGHVFFIDKKLKIPAAYIWRVK